MIPTLLLAIALVAPDLRLELQRKSLTGTHHRYRQYIDGLPVVGGETNVTLRRDGSREEYRMLAVKSDEPRARVTTGLVWVNSGGIALLARPETTVEGQIPRIRYVDPQSGALLREEVLAYPGKPALVFDPNPVVKLNAPGLRDRSDAADAVPAEAYDEVELPDVRESGPLGGPWVQIADFQAPFVAPVDASRSLRFDRSESGFEDVNAYFHVDRSQRHLQSLGYVGARALVPYAIETDTHAAGGTDNSFFIPSATAEGRGRLHFGTGGVDDAEDSDLIVHEYAHAIHEWIAPGTFLGPFGGEARAISEGFGDYFAFAAKYAAARASGRDPFCFADWDARCWEDPSSDMCAYPQGADCLRRLDSGRTFADYVRSDSAGTEHRNGEIWSAALVEIFLALVERHGIVEARRITDSIVIESFFGSPPRLGFEAMAARMVTVDRYLSGGRNSDVICQSMNRRGILNACLSVPRGEVTYVPGDGTGAVVPDNEPRGVTLSAFVSDPRPIERFMVAVNIRHTGRGELRVSLVAPDGTSFVLYAPSGERAADLVTTFGRDSIPIDSLEALRGRSAAGEWQLRVVDVAFQDVATIVSWGLVIQFAGDEPAATRPSAPGPRQVVPVVGYSPGANDTFFRSDLRMLNRLAREVEVLLIFTPSGADGRSDFAAARVAVPAGTVIVLDDLVRTLFGTAGLGQLEIIGEVVASTRTWTPAHGGTFGAFVPAADVGEATGEGEASEVVHLRDGPAFRSNIGFAEVAGRSGRVTFRFSHAPQSTLVFEVLPHTHLQVAVPASGFDNSTGSMHAEVMVAGGARVLAYSATIDNRSGDPIFVPAQHTPAAAGVIPAISSSGLAGTFWRTEIASGSAREGTTTVTYATSSETITGAIPAGTVISDVVAAVFHRSGTRGVISADAGTAVLTARIWTEGPNGTYGQFVPFREPSSASSQDILHVQSSHFFRTNIGLLSDTGSIVRVTIHDAAGAVIRTTHHSLGPLQLEQFQVTDPVLHGRARVEVLSGRVYAYGSVVDNHTGDGIFVPAQ